MTGCSTVMVTVKWKGCEVRLTSSKLVKIMVLSHFLRLSSESGAHLYVSDNLLAKNGLPLQSERLETVRV